MYYLRDRTGKSARIAEKIRKKIGIEVDVKSDILTQENLATVEEDLKVETVKDEVKNQTKVQTEPKKESSEEKK